MITLFTILLSPRKQQFLQIRSLVFLTPQCLQPGRLYISVISSLLSIVRTYTWPRKVSSPSAVFLYSCYRESSYCLAIVSMSYASLIRSVYALLVTTNVVATNCWYRTRSSLSTLKITCDSMVVLLPIYSGFLLRVLALIFLVPLIYNIQIL